MVDIGCGSGQLVRCLLADGYDAAGIDVSPEQVALARRAGLGTGPAAATTATCSANARPSWPRSPRPTCLST